MQSLISTKNCTLTICDTQDILSSGELGKLVHNTAVVTLIFTYLLN